MLIYGIIGLGLLAFAWIVESFNLIKGKKQKHDLIFKIIYVVGSLFLVVYSILINDIIFLILNSLISFLSLLALVINLKRK